MATRAERDAIAAGLGGVLWVGLGQAWPETVTLLNNLYRDRVARLAFLPADWLEQVLALNGDGGDLYVPADPLAPRSIAIRSFPSWVADDNARKAWSEVARAINSALGQYAAGKAAEGRRAVNIASSNADWWNTLYTLASVAQRPIQAVAAAAGAGARAVGVAAGAAGKVALVAGLVLLGLGGIWAYRRFGGKRRAGKR